MHCMTCGYNLNALEEQRCPECGRAFDPGDTKSWSTAKAYRYIKPAKIAGWVAVVLTLLITGYLIFQIAIGQDDWIAVLIYWILAAAPVLTAVLIWMGCLAMCQHRPTRRARWTLTVLVLLNISLLIQWPIHASFLLHQSTLYQEAQQVLANRRPTPPYRIGIYRVQGIRTISTPRGTNAVAFKIDGGTGPDYFVYGMTDYEIENHFNIWSYKRLDSNWHIVHED